MEKRVFADPRNTLAYTKQGMVKAVKESVKQAEQGNHESFKRVISYIRKFSQFRVEMTLDRLTNFNGVMYSKGEKVTQFYCASECFMAVYKDKESGEIMVFVDANSLLTTSEINAKYAELWREEAELERVQRGGTTPRPHVFCGKL